MPREAGTEHQRIEFGGLEGPVARDIHRHVCHPLSAGMPAMSATTSSHLPGNGHLIAYCVLDRRRTICIAMRAARRYHIVLYRSTRLIRREDGWAATSGFDSTRPPGKGP